MVAMLWPCHGYALLLGVGRGRVELQSCVSPRVVAQCTRLSPYRRRALQQLPGVSIWTPSSRRSPAASPGNGATTKVLDHAERSMSSDVRRSLLGHRGQSTRLSAIPCRHHNLIFG
jgi:hypothetical protein